MKNVIEKHFCQLFQQNVFSSENYPNIEPRTTIQSDFWRAYVILNEHRFTHKTVNHSENFVDPRTESPNTVYWRSFAYRKKEYDLQLNGASPLLERQLKGEW